MPPHAMWNLPPPPGFVGFDPTAPVRIYERDLPHWRQEGVTYFTTFRLADSLPVARLHELAALRTEWERLHPPPRSEAQWEAPARMTVERVEQWLDEGAGSCVLQQDFAADILEEKLRHFDGERYELGAYVVMPNHVHAFVRPYSDAQYPLEAIEQGWKGFSSREIGAARGVKGQLWQMESYDRIVRDEEHLWHCLQYIGDNPRKARIGPHQARRWVSPIWVRCGWKFEAG